MHNVQPNDKLSSLLKSRTDGCMQACALFA